MPTTHLWYLASIFLKTLLTVTCQAQMSMDALVRYLDHVEKLYEGGCADALVGVGKKGFISLNFIRQASSAYEAVSSAITDVKRTIPCATLIEATPDFVGLTDAAKILGCTRQNIRKLIVTNEPGAPLPVYQGTPSIWRLAEILIWLREAKMYSIDDTLTGQCEVFL